MSVPQRLTSPQNPRVKAAVALGQRQARDESGLFAVEGAREILRALSCGYALIELFHCPEASSPAAEAALKAAAGQRQAARYEVTAPVFAKLAVRHGSDGLLAVFRQKAVALGDLKLPPAPLVLAVQGVEKPGNLGALLRSADGAGADAVVVLDEALDLYNPHVIRASLGTAFSLAVTAASSAEFRAWCAVRPFKIFAAALTPGAVVHHEADFRGPVVILLGAEAPGLTADWLAAADVCVRIPLRGIADSLNVSTAGAVLLYEALRQRG